MFSLCISDMEPLKNPMQRLLIFGDFYEDLFTDL